jgi:LAGLIDADG endonuclease
MNIMDNQQGNFLQWYAGFIDGEGCFDFTRSANKSLKIARYSPRLRVTNTHERTIEYICQNLTSLELPYHVYDKKPKNPQWSMAWSIVVVGMKRIPKYLSVLTPLLVTKRGEAVKMMEFITSRLSQHPQDAYTALEMSIIEDLMNHQGKKPSTTTRLDSPIVASMV